MQNPPLICILAGQSDMVGRGEPNELTDEFVGSIVDSGHNVGLLYEIDRLNKEGAPSDSGGEYRPLTRTAQYSNAGKRYSFGPEWGIADSILSAWSRNSTTSSANSRRDVYFVKFAAGSTNLHEDWAPSGELFSGLVALVRHGVRKVALEWTRQSSSSSSSSDADTNRFQTTELERIERLLLRNHTAFFWLQGHSDAGGKAVMRTTYGRNFVAFCTALRDELLGMHNIQQETELGEEANSSPGLNFPIVASELDWPLDENSKSSLRFAKRLREVNGALREACERLNSIDGITSAPGRSGSEHDKQSSPSLDGMGPSGRVPCIFAEFPSDAESFTLSYHADGHCDNGGLLSLGRNMGRHFCEAFFFAGDSV